MLDWWRSERAPNLVVRSLTLLFLGFGAGFAHQDQFVFGKDEEIEDVQNACRVNKQEREEPVAVVIPGGFPERES